MTAQREYICNRTIEQSYKKYPFYSDVFPIIEDAINLETRYFADINTAMINGFCERLKITPQYVRSRDLNVDGLKSTLLLDISKEVNVDTYIAGSSGREYLDMQSFKDAGIRVVFNDFAHSVYDQR